MDEDRVIKALQKPTAYLYSWRGIPRRWGKKGPLHFSIGYHNSAYHTGIDSKVARNIIKRKDMQDVSDRHPYSQLNCEQAWLHTSSAELNGTPIIGWDFLFDRT